MRKEDIQELHYIAPIDNLLLILKDGILCHNKVETKSHKSVADKKVQLRRVEVVIPGGKKLHDYANLYFHARNPMMRAIVDNNRHKNLVVLRIDLSILNKPKIVIADSNASSDYVHFYALEEGLAKLDKNLVLAEDWNHPDYYEKCRRKSIRCAEVLVPDCIPPSFVMGGYVSCEEALQKVKKLLTGFPIADNIAIDANLFFQ